LPLRHWHLTRSLLTDLNCDHHHHHHCLLSWLAAPALAAISLQIAFHRRGNLARVSHPGGRLRARIVTSSGAVFSWDSGGDSAYSFLALSNCVVTAVLNTWESKMS